MSGNRSKLIAFNYFGGKITYLDQLYDYFPVNFVHFADVFGGSFAVTLNYKGKIIKTVNEINCDITNFFEVLRDHEPELIRLLEFTPCSREEYERCWEKSDDKIENARRFYVRLRQSFMGLGSSRQNKGWDMCHKTCLAEKGSSVSKWNNAIPKLHKVALLLRKEIQITNYDAFDFIKKLDFKDIFFYEDPPYLESVRNSRNNYTHEFPQNKHIKLAELNHKLKGKVMISGYDSKLYNELYSDWTKISFPSKKNGIRTKEVQEVVWFNYPIEDTVFHQRKENLKKYGTPVYLDI
jgi:DNA adenine methylase